MWKKSLLALCLISHFAWAEKKAEPAKLWTEAELQQQLSAQKQQLAQKFAQREKQRALFVQTDSLLSTARAQNKLPEQTQQLIERMIAELNGYPLQNALRLELQKTRFALNLASQSEIEQFIQQNPNSAEAKRLQQAEFERLFAAQSFTELLAYAQKVAPTNAANQCRLFAAKFQLLAEQTAPNPEAEQAANTPSPQSSELTTLLNEFGEFWAKGTAPSAFWLSNGGNSFSEGDLPQECGAIAAYWRDQGLNTADLVKARAVNLVEKNAKAGLEALQDNELNSWLSALRELLANPQNLQKFAENQPLAAENQAVIKLIFPRFVRTLSENMLSPNFAPYQQWADKFQLSQEDQNSWKASFISRLFDNTDETFQTWRDAQILSLKNDNLTERRLRMAIWQQTDLKAWLDALSSEGKNKLEWRYWAAKIDPTQREKLLGELAKERGFYPMLAAQQLGKNYQYAQPTLKETIKNDDLTLNEIAEYRALGRVATAKARWIEWLKTLPFEQQVALAQHANEQGWYDLGVEATIQAKAWAYIDLRLPKAYLDWFKLNLVDKSVDLNFAMAIARQESAWSPQVKSHANAVGLMQMLPSTAKMTADNSGLLYRGENDLLEPFRNIMLGTAHLAELNQKYPNNRILIASAYNAGASRADKWLARANGKLAMDEFIASIPFVETRGYVQNVLAYAYYYQQINGVTSPQMFTPEELRRY